ncbi:MAG: quinolinate synthase NadA [Bacteroidales bacterium]|jgi:quinolinate synthase|nr:quinolinate synthase NadA [Bacteroidales bacterium]
MILSDLVSHYGFLNLPVPEHINLKEEILRLKKEKNAILLAHFYQHSEIQEIADFIGDSLALAQKAQNNSADIIVFAGVHFMAETAKILSPQKKVLIPDLNAGCSLADSCNPQDFKQFIDEHPNHKVVSYVNTSAAIKMLTDVVCTSSNVVKIIKSFPKEQQLIFAPDRNLGRYVAQQTGRDLVVWNGACTIHERFSLEKILELKQQFPDAKILSHPECTQPILAVSDFIGSTAHILEFSKTDSAQTYIVVTESGILYKMREASPQKTFIPAPPNDSTCACNDCEFMRLITLKKIYTTLLYELPEVQLSAEVIEKARKPIERMLELS